MQRVGFGNGAELLLEQMKQILPRANQNLLTIARDWQSQQRKKISNHQASERSFIVCIIPNYITHKKKPWGLVCKCAPFFLFLQKITMLFSTLFFFPLTPVVHILDPTRLFSAVSTLSSLHFGLHFFPLSIICVVFLPPSLHSFLIQPSCLGVISSLYSLCLYTFLLAASRNRQELSRSFSGKPAVPKPGIRWFTYSHILIPVVTLWHTHKHAN